MMNIIDESNLGMIKEVDERITSRDLARSDIPEIDSLVEKLVPQPTCVKVRAAHGFISAMKKAINAQQKVLNDEITTLKQFGASVANAIKERKELADKLAEDYNLLRAWHDLLGNWRIIHDDTVDDDTLV